MRLFLSVLLLCAAALAFPAKEVFVTEVTKVVQPMCLVLAKPNLPACKMRRTPTGSEEGALVFSRDRESQKIVIFNDEILHFKTVRASKAGPYRTLGKNEMKSENNAYIVVHKCLPKTSIPKCSEMTYRDIQTIKKDAPNRKNRISTTVVSGDHYHETNHLEYVNLNVLL